MSSTATRVIDTEAAQAAIEKALADAPPLTAKQKSRLHEALDENLRRPHE